MRRWRSAKSPSRKRKTPAAASSRVGKLRHPKERMTIHFAQRRGGGFCGHQHTTREAATRCAARQKDNGWYVTSAKPARAGEGREVVVVR